MFTSNPFSEISGLISPLAMQAYVILMVLLVAGGTILDMIHKQSAKYFFKNAEKAKTRATRQVSVVEKVSIAVTTVAVDVLTSGEFCNQRRRVAHLLTMYGFILFAATTAIMIFGYIGSDTPVMLPLLWHLGALMLCGGGYWFWFYIRVDVAAEGNPWYRVIPADLFILSLLATATFALLWSFFQAVGASWLVEPFLRFIYLCRHGAFRWRIVVQVRSHVLQACRGFSETRSQGGWFKGWPAATCRHT